MSQTVEEFPNGNVIAVQPPPEYGAPPSHSNGGSFGPVFAVLAVIVVVSAVACVLGRLCTRRGRRGKESKKAAKVAAGKSGGGGLGPKEWEARQKPSFNMNDGGDIEFGFDFKKKNNNNNNNNKNNNSAGKGGKSGAGKAAKPMPPQYNGGHNPEVRFSDVV
ncbi:uncharacterized protein LOC127245599 [Andrographis paniculata]|uniref:uncharacterized protein LOC127245599 n=1 Tax=Andrographis paniculata TaxID=175694 RepID=UPI0021E7AF83|nr:uncharacterized protein LOC127245599 [Andrographis paniculata]